MDDDWARCDAQAAVAALSARYRFSLANAVQLLRDAGILRQREHDEQHERDGQQARNGDQKATQDVLTHREGPRLACDQASRYQSWMLSVSFAQPLSAGLRVLAAASTLRRCITGMNTVSCQSRSLHLM